MPVKLIETTEEDSFLAVVNFIGDLLNEGQVKTALAETSGSRFVRECEALLAEANVKDFLERLIEHLSLLYSKCTPKDALCCTTVMIHLVPKVGEDKEVRAAKELADALASKTDQRAEERLSALMTLFSVVERPLAKYPVLMTVLEYAKKAPGLAKILAPAIKGKAEVWIQDWKLPDTLAVQLYLNAASIHKIAGDKVNIKESLRLVTAALAMIPPQGLKELDHKALATGAINTFVGSPDLYQCDLVDLPVVKQLEQDPETAPLYKLLTVMLEGDLPGYKAIISPALLKQVQLTEEAALQKMRMMALLVLGSRCCQQEQSYQQIQEALDISEDEVEAWVIKGVGCKVLECKIDQVRKMVTITKCNHRAFRQTEWKKLHHQLQKWKDGIGGVLDMMAHNKITGPRPLHVR